MLLCRMSYQFLLSYRLQISLLHLRMLRLDHFRFILAVLVLLQGLLLNHLLCHHHLLLRFRNHLMIYLLPFKKVLNLLLTHYLFIIFSTFITYRYLTLPLSLPCLLSLPLTTLVKLSHPSWRQVMAKEMDALYSMTHGSLSLFLLASLLLVVVGSI